MMITLIAVGGILVGCSKVNSFGVPTGYYYIYVDGEIKNGSSEWAWNIKKNSAEYLYVVFSILEEDGKQYFYNERKNAEGTATEVYKFEFSYNKDTELLTVHMPSKYTPSVEDNVTPQGEEVAEVNFKKKEGLLS